MSGPDYSFPIVLRADREPNPCPDCGMPRNPDFVPHCSCNCFVLQEPLEHGDSYAAFVERAGGPRTRLSCEHGIKSARVCWRCRAVVPYLAAPLPWHLRAVDWALRRLP